MSKTYKTEGVILKRWEHREKDKAVRIFTRDYGKITARAISARKITSKLAGHLEPFVYTDLFIARSKTIDIVAGSQIIHANPTLRTSIHHNALANYFAEVVDKFTDEQNADPELFHHVFAFFQWLNSNDANALVMYSAILQLFPLLGYMVDLYTCHKCHEPITEEGVRFVYSIWNVQCANCSTQEDTITMSPQVIKTLRFLLSEDFPTVARLQLDNTTWEDVHQFFRSIIQYQLHRPLPAEHVFTQLLNQPVSSAAS